QGDHYGENRRGGGGGGPRPPRSHPGSGTDFGTPGAPPGMVRAVRGPAGQGGGGAARSPGGSGGAGAPLFEGGALHHGAARGCGGAGGARSRHLRHSRKTVGADHRTPRSNPGCPAVSGQHRGQPRCGIPTSLHTGRRRLSGTPEKNPSESGGSPGPSSASNRQGSRVGTDEPCRSEGDSHPDSGDRGAYHLQRGGGSRSPRGHCSGKIGADGARLSWGGRFFVYGDGFHFQWRYAMMKSQDIL